MPGASPHGKLLLTFADIFRDINIVKATSPYPATKCIPAGYEVNEKPDHFSSDIIFERVQLKGEDPISGRQIETEFWVEENDDEFTVEEINFYKAIGEPVCNDDDDFDDGPDVIFEDEYDFYFYN